MTRFRKSLVAACTAGAALATATSGIAAAAPLEESFVYTLVPNNGNPEGVAWDAESATFFTGTTLNGTIYRGTLGDPTVDVWVPGGTGRAAIGMKVFEGKLYVAGGGTGVLRVFDIASATEVATFATGAGGFLNDLVVTPRGIFVTDSRRPVLWTVSHEQVAAGGGTPGAIPTAPEIPFNPAAFNLNGIVAYDGGRELVVVHSGLGTLYKIAFAPDGSRTITQITAPTVNGDGMLVDQGQLIVVLGNAAQLAFLNLDAQRSTATLVETRTDPTFQRPSTLDRARNSYLVVNADFTTNTPPFTVSQIAR